VSENGVLRLIFGQKRDEVVGVSGNPHVVKLHNFYSLPSVMRIINSRRMRLKGLYQE
jgi:hypothetical protein